MRHVRSQVRLDTQQSSTVRLQSNENTFLLTEGPVVPRRGDVLTTLAAAAGDGYPVVHFSPLRRHLIFSLKILYR